MAYWTAVALGALFATALCVAARTRPGPWAARAARAIGGVLAADAVSYVLDEVARGAWSARTSLPLALCNAAVVVAAVACWWRRPLLVELTYFWGVAGTLQGLATPDLSARFPHLVFFEYVVGHLGVVTAALFLVLGMRITPRAGAVSRVTAVTAGYTALVGLVDGLTGANYMFLSKPPGEWTLLRLLGPWPWYAPAAAVVACALFVLLDLPFRAGRRRVAGDPRGARPPGRRRVARLHATIGGVPRRARRPT